MADYLWQLGFDFNAAQNDNSQFDLATGLASAGEASEPVSSMAGINEDDTISFQLFNITTEAAGDFIISDVTIQFRNAESEDTTTCPFNTAAVVSLGDSTTAAIQTDETGIASLEVGTHLSSQGSETSAIFSPSSALPSWLIAGPITLATPGDYLFSISLAVQGPDGSEGTTTMIFTADPEMVVGSLGGGAEAHYKTPSAATSVR